MAAGGLINHNDSDKADNDVSSVTWDSDIPTCQYVPNLSICQTIDKSIRINFAAEHSPEYDDYTKFRLELDSHANMPVVSSGAYILAHSGKTADISAYNPNYKSKQIPLVDAALQYNSPYDGKTYILVIRNALHVPSMDNHLIPHL
jgi:hypothetical protein